MELQKIVIERPLSDYVLDLAFFCLKIIFFFITLFIIFICIIYFLDNYTISQDINYYWNSVYTSLFW